MSIKLTDAQRAMLSAAAMREDRCLTPAQSLRGGQIRKTGEKLIEAGLVREVKAKPSSPVWRRDGQTGSAFALRLTAAGAKAIAVEGKGGGRPLAPKDLVASANANPATGSSPDAYASEAGAASHSAPRPTSNAEPRPGSKIAALIGMLTQDKGATIGELVTATGWLAHTTRAALTGLRKRGYILAIDRSNRERGSVYRIEAKPGEAESGAGDVVVEAA